MQKYVIEIGYGHVVFTYADPFRSAKCIEAEAEWSSVDGASLLVLCGSLLPRIVPWHVYRTIFLISHGSNNGVIRVETEGWEEANMYCR